MPSEDAELSVLTTPQALSALAEGPLTIPLTVPWGKVYRRHLFDGCRFPVGRVHEDIFVAHRLLHRARGVATTSQVLYYYWQRPDSMMGSGPSEKSVRDAVDGLLEQARFMQDEGFERESVLVVKQAVLKFSKFTFRHAGPRSYLPGPWNSPFQREVRKVLLQCRPFRGSAGLGSNVYLAAHLFFPVEANRLSKVLRKYHQPSEVSEFQAEVRPVLPALPQATEGRGTGAGWSAQVHSLRHSPDGIRHTLLLFGGEMREHRQ